MKFSLPLLFFLAFIVAVEMRLRKTHDSDPTLAVAAVYLLLTWNWLTGFLRLTSNNRKVTKLINFFFGACVSVGAYALYKLLFPRVASIYQTVSVESLLILSTLILANSAVFATPRKTSTPLYALRIVSFASLFLVCFSIVMGSSLWVGYMSCKEIEMSMDDANHILGATDILVSRIALQKTLFGVFGFAIWLYVAFLTYQRIQQRPHGSFPRIWLVASIGFFATFLEWRFLLRDFPQLWEAIGATAQAHTNLNVACFAILSVIAFAQYCAADRGKTCPKTDAQQLWKNRLLGLAMLTPFIWLFVEVTYFLLQIGGGRLPRLDSMIRSMLLTDPRPFLLAALLLMGVRAIANASNDPTSCRPLPQSDLAQLVCKAFILVVLLPMQLAAFQFYFNAVLTLQP